MEFMSLDKALMAIGAHTIDAVYELGDIDDTNVRFVANIDDCVSIILAQAIVKTFEGKKKYFIVFENGIWSDHDDTYGFLMICKQAGGSGSFVDQRGFLVDSTDDRIFRSLLNIAILSRFGFLVYAGEMNWVFISHDGWGRVACEDPDPFVERQKAGKYVMN